MSLPNALRHRALWIGVVCLGACASLPAPDTELRDAQRAVDEAISAGADKQAPIDLRLAQEQLAAAEAAINERKHDVALRLAEEAALMAGLAESKAMTATLRAKVDTQRTENARLRRELLGKEGEQ